MKWAECTGCLEEKPIVRRLALANADGVILDSGAYCADSWSGGLRQALDEQFSLRATAEVEEAAA